MPKDTMTAMQGGAQLDDRMGEFWQELAEAIAATGTDDHVDRLIDVIGSLVASFPVGILIGFAVAAQGIKSGLSKAVLLTSLVLVGLGSLGFIIGDSLGAYFVGRLADIRDISFAPLRVIDRFGSQRARVSSC